MHKSQLAFKREAISIISGLLLLYVVIEAFTYYNGLPQPPQVWKVLIERWRDGSLSHDVSVTLARWLIGWSLGSAAGIVLGLITGRLRIAALVLEKPFILARAIPTIALVPLALRLAGLSEAGKIGICAWATGGVAWILIHQAAHSVSPKLRWRAQTLRLSTTVWVFSVLLPEISVAVLSALRASLSIGLIVLAVAEMTGVYDRSSGIWWSEGLGYRLNRSRELGDDAGLLATIFVFSLMALIAEQVLILSWKLSQGASRLWRQRRVNRLMDSLSRMPVEDLKWGHSARVVVKNLSASYNGVLIFDCLDFHIDHGQTLTLLGISGTGKTTLIKALAGLTENDLRIQGVVALESDPANSLRPVVGVMFQDSEVFSGMTVWDNVTVSDRFRHGDRQILGEAYQLLKTFGLLTFASRQASTLSGGQRQRLAFATVLATKPGLLLLDESFGSLDSITRNELQEFYWNHIHNHVTALFVTHDLSEAVKVGDQIRVGLQSGETASIPPHSSPLDQWEFHPEYLTVKAWALNRLKATLTVEG